MSSNRFAPLFWTQFLGAFNDNIYKNALIILFTYNTMTYTSIKTTILIPLCAGLFILPFFLFSAVVGQLADKYEKSALIRKIKMAEVTIMTIAAIGFYLQNIWFLLIVLFLMGSQSSVFGPVKYSILPQHLDEEGLLKGNGVIAMGTFLAILLGTLTGGLMIMIPEYGRVYISLTLILIALAGWLNSRNIPLAVSANRNLDVNWNIFTETFRLIALKSKNKLLWGAILAISWFWFYGATILTILPGYTRDILVGNEQVVTLLLTLFSIGIGLGSILAGKSGNLQKSLKWVVVGSIGLSVFSIDLYWASASISQVASSASNTNLNGWLYMFENVITIHILVDILLLGIMGGLYIVPLYVMLQEYSDIKSRSRTIAANNIMNAFFMVISALVMMSMLSMGFSLFSLFAMLGVANVFVMLFIYYRYARFVGNEFIPGEPSAKT
jgi:MFS family permease